MAEKQLAILTDENISQAIYEQLIAKGVKAERVINVLPEGTSDPELLEWAHTRKYALLTHDQAIRKHIKARQEAGKEHAGVFIISRHLQGTVGPIVTYLVELNEYIEGGAASVEEDVYNIINPIR